MTESAPPDRFTYPARLRLSGARVFDQVFASRMRATSGPLTVHARPNGLTDCRLGLSVPRRVGTAPVRNLIKRRLREVFRLKRHEWPGGYDLVVSVRPHEPLPLAQYERALGGALRSLHQSWSKKKEKKTDQDKGG